MSKENIWMKRFWISATFLAGCVSMQPLGRSTLVVRPEIGRTTQTTINPYTQADINHLTLKLFTTVEQDLGINKDLLNAQLDNPIVFSNLKNNTNYRIRAYAYATAGTGSCISTNDSSSYTDVLVGTDDRPVLATLSVRLIDRDFNGQASSTLVVNPGGYSTVGSASLDIPRIVTTLAGNGVAARVDGLGTAASLNWPVGISMDSAGYIYVAEQDSHRIRKISPAGMVVTIAGNGQTDFADGTGTAATFHYPYGVTAGNNGNLYVADTLHHRIRKIDSNGVVTTVAGNGVATFADGTGTSASFNRPSQIAVDTSGNLFVADLYNSRIRKIDTNGVVTTFAGNGNSTFADGTGTMAAVCNPFGITIDTSNNLYVADSGNKRIRKITPARVVTTFAGNGNSAGLDGIGTNAAIGNPQQLCIDASGTLYVPDSANSRVLKITSDGTVKTIAGNGSVSFADGPATAASFNTPIGAAIDAYGNLYVSDMCNHRIRKIQ